MNSDTIKPGNYVTGSIFCTYGQGAELMGGGKFRALFLILVFVVAENKKRNICEQW